MAETLAQQLHFTETMTPRERVQAAFSHTIPDRVPVNYSANGAIDRRLKEHFGLAHNDSWGLARALGVDFVSINPPYKGPRLHAEVEGINVDPMWGIHTKWVEHGAGGYFDFVDFPLRNASLEQIAEWPMPNPDDFDYEWVTETSKKYEDFALYLGGAGTPDCINSTGMMRNMEQVLLDILTEDPAWQLLVDRKSTVLYEVIKRSFEAAEGRVSLLWMGEDLGTQDRPLLSIESFRRMIRPRHQKFIDLAKSCGNLPVMIHSCGSSSWAFNDFIEMGVNVVDTLQPEAKNMEPAYLKRTYGDKLAFHGCISTAGPVSFGTVEDVIQDCRQILDTMMPGGGYCFAPTHALQDNSPTENVVAMYECAYRYGRY